jgi:hypothetical protein
MSTLLCNTRLDLTKSTLVSRDTSRVALRRPAIALRFAGRAAAKVFNSDLAITQKICPLPLPQRVKCVLVGTTANIR